MSLSTNVSIYGAVMAQNEILVNVEDNVAFKDRESEKVLSNYDRHCNSNSTFSFRLNMVS